jgi:hypothetical protein
MRRRGRERSVSLSDNSSLAKVVEYISETVEPAQLFELYYWSQDQELLKIVRACAGLPESQRHLIASFFENMSGNKLMSADWKGDGQLVLCCRCNPVRSVADIGSPRPEAKRRANK